ncbi:MAG: hypothetical protein GX221_03710 [Candidatus Riflebacteria bacterium]|nr:hypothetical protein [Candidatus Riflebacteria bacterium]
MKNSETSKLHSDLRNERAEIRKAAIAKAKKLDNPQALRVLIAALDSQNAAVLSDLSKAIISYGEESFEPLIEAFSADKWRVRQGASKVVSSMSKEMLSKLMESVPENEPDVDYWMVQTLGAMGSEAVSYLARNFAHENHKISLAAVRAAQKVRDPEMVEELLKLLDSPSWPMRKAAYDSLEVIYPCNLDAVVAALDSCSNESSYWIIKLLAQQAMPELTDKFAEIVETAPMESKLEAIKALAMIETPHAHHLLVGYLANKAWIVRKTAADAILLQGLGVSDDLVSAMKDANEDARYWSLKVLGEVKEPKIFSQILNCLGDSQSSVRSAACQALGSMGDAAAVPYLMQMLNDESEDVRTSSILALSQIGEKNESKISPKAVKSSQSSQVSVPKATAYTCEHCGKNVSSEYKYCPYCLTPVKKNSCAKCGRTLEPGWTGCPDCGTAA